MKKDDNLLSSEDFRSSSDSPLRRFDALTAGIKAGGLRSIGSINLLVSYIVANMQGKVTAATIIEAMDEGGLANHFEISDSVARMLKSGVIEECEDGTLMLGDTKGASIELIEKDLPLSVREESIHLCHKIIAREKFLRENKAEITQTDKGFELELSISDIDTDYMRLTLFTTTREQAELIKEKFISNPVAVYETVIDSIFDNE